MAMQQLSTTMFMLLNASLVVGYAPQFVRIYRDRNGAAAVSVAAWAAFAATNGATVIYAVVNTSDLVAAGTFGINAIGCSLIAALALIKRLTHSS